MDKALRSRLREQLKIRPADLEEVNRFMQAPDNELIEAVFDVVAKYGAPEEINAKARRARELPNLLGRLKDTHSPYLEDLEWLTAQRDRGAFVSIPEYRRKVLGERADTTTFDERHAVTLEISAMQYFPWLIAEARQAIDRREVMPGRIIRVRKMKEQESDQGDILAVAAAVQIIGATYVDTLDTRGTDGSNVHLGGPDTITGYFGGIGSPNDYPLKWVDELLYYYTEYGVPQVLNTNSGTVFLGYLLYRMGIDIGFKISVYMGNDNPFSMLWTLMMARLLCREDLSTPLVGFNISNSVNAKTIEATADIRRRFNLEDKVRIEHHITETCKHIVRQPYLRRDELLQVASTVANISAKHEGGDPEVEETREHPSDILEYFLDKEEIINSGLMPALERSYLDKHEALNRTAAALTRKGIAFVAAWNLHAKQ
jgi:hypothetical protein